MSGGLLLVDNRLTALAAAVDGYSLQHIAFDRDDTDSYRIRVEEIRGADEPLTRAQVVPALPVGSRWADATTWESYVVYPQRLLGVRQHVAIVALEYVVPHPSRGAYPVFAGAVIPLHDVPAVLRHVADALDPGDTTNHVAGTHGVVPFASQSRVDHMKPAAWLLRAAGSAFEQGQQLLVRTAILTEDEVPRARALLSPRSMLLGTVPALRARFSWTADKVLRGLQRA